MYSLVLEGLHVCVLLFVRWRWNEETDVEVSTETRSSEHDNSIKSIDTKTKQK